MTVAVDVVQTDEHLPHPVHAAAVRVVIVVHWSQTLVHLHLLPSLVCSTWQG